MYFFKNYKNGNILDNYEERGSEQLTQKEVEFSDSFLASFSALLSWTFFGGYLLEILSVKLWLDLLLFEGSIGSQCKYLRSLDAIGQALTVASTS